MPQEWSRHVSFNSKVIRNHNSKFKVMSLSNALATCTCSFLLNPAHGPQKILEESPPTAKNEEKLSAFLEKLSLFLSWPIACFGCSHTVKKILQARYLYIFNSTRVSAFYGFSHWFLTYTLCQVCRVILISRIFKAMFSYESIVTKLKQIENITKYYFAVDF